MTVPHRVVLVREWDAQASGSGCCGRLGGVLDELGEPGTYAHVRVDMERMGAVYRALRSRWPREEVDIAVVDPRNMIWLVPTIWRDARRRGLSRRQAWCQVRGGIAQNAIIVDGAVVSTSVPEHPAAAVALVGAALSSA